MRPLAARLLDHIRIDPDTGCWLWTGAQNNKGYGRVREGGRGSRIMLAHRASYEVFVGPIPDDQPQIDHECEHRRCINPEHLKPVDNATNNFYRLYGRNVLSLQEISEPMPEPSEYELYAETPW